MNDKDPKQNGGQAAVTQRIPEMSPGQLDTVRQMLAGIMGAQAGGGQQIASSAVGAGFAIANRSVEAMAKELERSAEDRAWLRARLGRVEAAAAVDTSARQFRDHVIAEAVRLFPSELDQERSPAVVVTDLLLELDQLRREKQAEQVTE